MTHYIGLDVSQKMTLTRVVDKFRSAVVARPVPDGSGANQACCDAARRRGCLRVGLDTGPSDASGAGSNELRAVGL